MGFLDLSGPNCKTMTRFFRMNWIVVIRISKAQFDGFELLVQRWKTTSVVNWRSVHKLTWNKLNWKWFQANWPSEERSIWMKGEMIYTWKSGGLESSKHVNRFAEERCCPQVTFGQETQCNSNHNMLVYRLFTLSTNCTAATSEKTWQICTDSIKQKKCYLLP